MTPREAREALAEVIRHALPTGWTVYDTPPEGLTAPCAVLTPRDPYRVASNVCAEEVRLACLLVAARAGSVAAVNILDDMATDVRTAINGSPDVMAVVEQVTALGASAEAGGITYLTVTLDIMVQV